MNQYAIVLTYVEAHKVYIFDDIYEARQGLKELYDRCLKWAIKENVPNPDTVCTKDYFEIKWIKNFPYNITANVVHVSSLRQTEEQKNTPKVNMLFVVCISTRQYCSSKPIVEKGNFYKIDPLSIWMDSDGDSYGMVYDNEDKQLGQMLLKHFSCL